MIKWSLLQQRLGSYSEIIEPFYKKGGIDKIYSFLKEETERGKRISPSSENTFRAFLKTPLNKVRVIVLGFCPYHTEGVADGLSLSCSLTGKLAPSLEKWYEALEIEFNNGLCLSCSKNPDLSYLTSDGGVLLLNSALTVEIGEAGGHNKIWEPFTKCIMTSLGSLNTPVIFLGARASMFGHLIKNEENIHHLTHPAFASYKKIKWDTGGTFKRVNDILIKRGIEPIEWLKEAPF